MVHVTSDDECASYDTMKYSGSDNEIMCGGPVDAILLNSSWGGSSEFYMDTSHKITMDNSHDDSNAKSTMDVLDSLIMNSSNNSNFAELKPLPPFTGYTGHLSINGIPGHHYHAIAAPQSPQSPHENNNNPNQVNNNVIYKNHNGVYYSVNSDQSVVSSTVDCGLVKNEPYVDYGGLIVDNIEDIAAIIGSAIADTTVPSVVDTLVSVEDPNGSRDSWMDLDAWIDTACSNNDANQPGKTIISPESLQEFNNTQYSHEEIPSSTLQNLLTQNQFHLQQQNAMKREPVSTNYQMPLLQSRLQNGPPINGIKENYMKNDYTILKSEYITECPEPSSTSYLNNKDIMLSHSTSGSPPGVVSTTDSMNGRYQPQRNRYGSGMRGTKSGIGSPDLLNGSSLDGLVGNVNNNNYPHTTTTTTTPSKKNRSRSSRKAQNSGGGGGGAGSVVYDGSLLGKEKPVHRCTICSRGFLNKSNIKVHLRTHTGEKPFRCEVCGKAFRQKAHLIKHQQIHKGVGRD